MINLPSRAPPVATLERHEAPDTHSLVDVDSPHVSSVPSDYETQSVKTNTQSERIEHEAQDAERKAKAAAEKTKAKARKASDRAVANADNPVVVGNAVVATVLIAVLGVGAYRKYKEGGLTWGLAAGWGAVVGAFAVGDVFVSRWLFEKYPPKK